MINVRVVYPDVDWTYGGPVLYDPLLESFGYEILLKVDDHDWQGDSRILYRNDNKYGILIFGWGSCSGCDALQGCESYEELDRLQSSLHDAIKWFDSAAECLAYFREHDWEGDYSWHVEETEEFIERAIKLLEDINGVVLY